ncbi:MAG: ribosome maturation factor RimM [Syntrophothermus sp.]
MSEFFLIAEIKSVFNKNGFLSLVSYSDIPDRFLKLRKVYIEIFGDKKEFTIEKVLWNKGKPVIKFLNFDSDREVEFLTGCRVFVGEGNLVKLSDDTFFIHDLIGSRVVRNGNPVGRITDVLTLPSNDVYVIKEDSGGELLVPAVKDYVESFDPGSKVLVLKPGGDLYEEESGEVEDDED